MGLGTGLVAGGNKDSKVVLVDAGAVLASCEEVSDGCSCEDGCSRVDTSGDDSMAEDCSGWLGIVVCRGEGDTRRSIVEESCGVVRENVCSCEVVCSGEGDTRRSVDDGCSVAVPEGTWT